MNDDLPQFDGENLTGGWAEITHAYDIAGFNFQPIALQLVGHTHRMVHTGLLISTEDVYAGDDPTPQVSTFYLEGTEKIQIVWSEWRAVLAMPGIAPTEGEKHE